MEPIETVEEGFLLYRYEGGAIEAPMRPVVTMSVAGRTDRDRGRCLVHVRMVHET